MANVNKRETFDEMDEVKMSSWKVVTMAVLFHLIAVIYVFLWQFLLTA